MSTAMTRSDRTRAILERLQVREVNSGACSGADHWHEDPAGTELISYDPTTGETLGRVIQATASTYDALVKRAHKRFQEWRTVPAPKRGLLIRDLSDALRAVQEPLGELITLEMGKIRAEGIGEVQEMIDICDFAVGLSRQLYGKTMHSERSRHRMYEQWHPLGPIGIITSFNFPAAVWSWNSALAAVCGDTMIWKPSPATPLVAIAIQHVANEVTRDHGFDGLFNLVIGENEEIGETMTADPRLPLISFTGSVRVGRKVAQTVASRLGRSLLELGGNNGIIVTADADLDLVVRAVLFGAVGTAGQRCTSTRRLFVQQKIFDQLAERLVEAYQQVPIGDPLDEKTLVGPLVNDAAVDQMEKALKRAVQEGGRILQGGGRLDRLGSRFVEPALVVMPRQTPLVCEETFAPILYLIGFESLNEAVELHNSVPQGLSSAIFTGSLQASERFLSAAGSDCGIANVNIGTSGAEIGGAFGGEKDTGGGRESGSDSWKQYMRRQTNTINWSDELPLAQGIEFG
ncbi:MAG TPA: aldehyde dehydrogenase family protein [Acidobacteriota bacterium]|nr:aldehyde dehydrogenase family protein [Acidobacteriota bacterium]